MAGQVLGRLREPIPIEDVERFKERVECDLPNDYVNFLRESNGGIPRDNLLFRYGGRDQEIRRFLDLNDSEHAMRELGRFVRGYLPLAEDFGDDPLCIELKSGSVARAKYSPSREHPDSVVVDHVADTFASFLDNAKLHLTPTDEVFELAKNCSREDLETLINSQSVDLNLKSRDGTSLLCEAIKYGNSDVVVYCIEHGASLKDAVHYATFNKRSDFVEILADAGADMNEVRDGQTPLDVCGTSIYFFEVRQAIEKHGGRSEKKSDEDTGR